MEACMSISKKMWFGTKGSLWNQNVRLERRKRQRARIDRGKNRRSKVAARRNCPVIMLIHHGKESM